VEAAGASPQIRFIPLPGGLEKPMKTFPISQLLGLFLAGTTVAESTKAEALHVTVYDKTNLTRAFAKQVADDLRLIFRESGIEIRWIAGAPDADEATLTIYDGTGGRDRERWLACHARRDIALSILPVAPSSVPTSVLGMSLPLASKGLNVMVYRDRIEAAALSRGVQESELLAHAIAHEIGHVLLRSGAHDGNGLMAGVWKAREYAWIATGSMFFDPGQSAAMRASMNGAGCPANASTKQ
jgi:hypothetical protein